MTDRLSARQRGYTRRWQKARERYLRAHPLCVYCERDGHAVPATVVDHVKPHRGDQMLFWDESNWAGLCKPHHDSTKQSAERTGRMPGCTNDGTPIDASHHWALGQP